MVMVLCLKSNTAPISCKVCLPMIRSYNGGGPPLEYSTISGCRCTFLLAEYSTKESSTLSTFLVLKVPLEVLHDSGTALLTMGMYLLDPFSKKRRSLLVELLLSCFFLGHGLVFREIKERAHFLPNCN